jgi:carbon-monoxide dehydrogenase small subunit
VETPADIPIVVTVNGHQHRLRTAPRQTLLKLLRDRLMLTGTKESCGEGECGACTVIVDGRAVNSCLMLAAEADGCNVLTIEGLAQSGELDPLQQAFIDAGAVQCGFCTPGMIMSAKSLLSRDSHPTSQQVKEALCGNLCRCTGYTRIIKAVLDAAEQLRGRQAPQDRGEPHDPDN